MTTSSSADITSAQLGETPLTNDDRALAASFGPGFVWGAATSAYQIEGSVDVDGRGESIWDRYCATPGMIADGSSGEQACDHYRLWRDDVDMIADLGLGAYRFSIAWPRVIPDGSGEVNPDGLDFYDRLVDALLDAGVEPYPTLYHWDLPQALEDTGGWTARATAEAFARYTEVVVARLGDRVRTWSTLNEPYCAAYQGHLAGIMAPGRQLLGDALAAAHHLLVAHGLAVERIRSVAPGAGVSIVLNFEVVVPASDRPDDVAAAELYDGRINRWFVEPIAGSGYPTDTLATMRWAGDEIVDGDMELIAAPIDALGVNYYTRAHVATADLAGPPPAGASRTASGWEIYPPGIAEVLERIHRAHAFPRYLVTENGAAMPDEADERGRVNDVDRIDYLRDHLVNVAAVRSAGVPVDGYFVWSLFDNFEWAQGYNHRFGIVRVDYDTMQRIPKSSAHWLGALARLAAGSGEV